VVVTYYYWSLLRTGVSGHMSLSQLCHEKYHCHNKFTATVVVVVVQVRCSALCVIVFADNICCVSQAIGTHTHTIPKGKSARKVAVHRPPL
jgi:hypothetical protein